jgi:hypothetical protein
VLALRGPCLIEMSWRPVQCGAPLASPWPFALIFLQVVIMLLPDRVGQPQGVQRPMASAV